MTLSLSIEVAFRVFLCPAWRLHRDVMPYTNIWLFGKLFAIPNLWSQRNFISEAVSSDWRVMVWVDNQPITAQGERQYRNWTFLLCPWPLLVSPLRTFAFFLVSLTNITSTSPVSYIFHDKLYFRNLHLASCYETSGKIYRKHRHLFPQFNLRHFKH